MKMARKNLPLAAIVLAWTSAGILTWADDAAKWLTVKGPISLSFPRDHGAHKEFRSEWWYVTGHVRDRAGREFGFQVTFFRQGIDPRPPQMGQSKLRAHHALAAHLAVADLTNNTLVVAQRLSRVDHQLADTSEQGLNLFLENWSMQHSPTGVVLLWANDREKGIGVDLELQTVKPLILHGVGGVSAKGDEVGNASVYVGWTRMTVRGRLVSNGEEHEVVGTAWFDHEWGTSQLGQGVVGWDWFGLQLDDGRELMLYLLRQADGRVAEQSAGTLVQTDGTTRFLTRDTFVVTPTGTWKSPRSGATYPNGWRVNITSEGIDLTVTPRLAAAELDTRQSTGTIYWEGPVAVRGSHKGHGYTELVGYVKDAPPPLK